MQQQQQQQRGSRQPRTAQRRRLEAQAMEWRTQPRRVPRDGAPASSWLGGVNSAQPQQKHRPLTPVQAVPLSVTEDGGDSSGCSSGSSWEREEEPGMPLQQQQQQQGEGAAAGARRWRLSFLPR
jgi:hypothetical protein